MGFTGNRAFLKGIFLLPFLLTASMWADWNGDFFCDSRRLLQTLDDFADPNVGYDYYLREFENMHVVIKRDSLYQALCQLEPETKKQYGFSDFVIKKRPYANVNEVYFWELAILLSLDTYAVPSYPLEAGSNRVILQPYVPFFTGTWINNLPEQETNTVSLRDYFYAHLLAFVLGADDLSGGNIGVTSCNNILFFDNEDVFVLEKVPSRTARSFYVPFVSVAFDWPQYSQPLDLALADELQGWVNTLQKKKRHLAIYASIRNLPDAVIIAIDERIDLLSGIPFQQGMTFSELFRWLYPKLALGLDELQGIVSDILEREVGPGIALFYATKVIRFMPPALKEQEALNEWIVHYID